ncbi:hypothetical protein ABZ920_14935 [Streptomyces sp. NPDC046831]|uniref:hypothetical protein n=1 Tax=Streptomyces sp. NPDC046831 TaxID=3154805 RepID=UPI0033FAAAEC
MSRETDTPSSGPNGRGGAAYPSGTPPYGTPIVSDDGADAGRSAAQPEERKTETTLTTRIRINIPGSRPIPPVVVRKPVAESEGTGGDAAETQAQPVVTSAGTTEPPAEPAAPAEEKAPSDWFAPRKSAPAKGGQGGGSTNGAGLPGGSGAPAGGTGTPAAGPGAGAGLPGAGAPGAGAPGGARPGAARPGGVVGSMTAPGAARPGGVVGSMTAPGGSRSGGASGARPGATNGAGLPGATGGPVAPGHGGGTGSFDVTEALAAGPLGGGARPGGGQPRRDDLPYFSEDGGQNGRPPRAGQHGPAGPAGYGGPGAPNGGPSGPSGFGGPGAPGRPGGPQAPAGPTGGPVTGDTPLTAVPGTTPGAAPGVPGTRPGGGLSDDTAVLTPQKPAPEPGAPGHGTPGNVSGHTVTSGIPVVPPGGNQPYGAGPGAGTVPQPAPKAAGPASRSAPAKKKKGRSKIALLGGGLVLVAGVAYGAGLLMNHSDVPKGTSVLGVDIGGGTRDDAVRKLDAAFGSRVNTPLRLQVDGRTVTLKPDQAGLQFDTQATASAAAKSDYNPVSVIGSLFGNHRVVDPVMPVDEEKLQVALQNASGAPASSSGGGAVTEGGIRFESGKAVPVYGKAGKGIDAAQSSDEVERAYRAQVETGAATPVRLPTTTRRPTVPDAEVDRMMKKFAQPAMSGKVTVKTADGLHSVAFSPEKSLWKFLQVKPVGGKLVESYDKAALKELYGGTFDGVLITRGTGQKTAVTVEDVISALRPALVSTTGRVGVIETDPS